MEEHPFPHLKIASPDFLDHVSGRSKCLKCGKSRKYYCYTCYLPVAEIADQVPKLKLPVKVDIIKHPAECDGKSTAVHAAVICPDDVTIYTYPCIPDYDDKAKVVLVFPGEDSVSLGQIAKLHTDEKNECTVSSTCTTNNTEILSQKRKLMDGPSTCVDLSESHPPVKKIKMDAGHVTGATNCGHTNSGTTTTLSTEVNGLKTATGPIERVVFVDSTWNQTRTICSDERLKGLRCVEIKSRKTQFWRHQAEIPDTYLSTVEAVYYFMRDYHENFIQSEYTGNYDNLLFFFVFMYKKIRTIYDGGGDLKAYRKRKKNKQHASNETT